GTVDAVQKISGWVSVKVPQSRRMQERRAAENWRLFDSASIEWLPVAADSTCSGRLINMFNLKLDICSTFRDRFCWHHY
ncbi:hypothetical protein DLN68_25480, partial [Salmonella enterica]|nr:hypothetical protein [Salmonella enterica]EBK4448030.1 hypothetical protein [Salmonella enterica]